MKCFKIVSIAATILLLVGCVNPYAKFYNGEKNAKTLVYYLPEAGPLKIYSSNDIKSDIDSLYRKGYQAIGSAGFNGPSSAGTKAQLRDQAASVGAQVVLISSQYTHTLTGAIPLTVPNNSTSYTTGQATAYGPGGTVNAYGNSTTTTYGTQTTMMPYNVARSDHTAVFLIKSRARVGILPVALDDATRKRMGTNSGVMVRLLVEGSPAFNADVLPGDILLAIADESVHSVDGYVALLNKFEGKTVAFRLARDGEVVVKVLHIGSYKELIE